MKAPSRQELDQLVREIRAKNQDRFSNAHAAGITPETIYKDQVRPEILGTAGWFLVRAEAMRDAGELKEAAAYKGGFGQLLACLVLSDRQAGDLNEDEFEVDVPSFDFSSRPEGDDS